MTRGTKRDICSSFHLPAFGGAEGECAEVAESGAQGSVLHGALFDPSQIESVTSGSEFLIELEKLESEGMLRPNTNITMQNFGDPVHFDFMEDFDSFMSSMQTSCLGRDLNTAMLSAEDLAEVARMSEIAAKLSYSAALRFEQSKNQSVEMQAHSRNVLEAARRALDAARSVSLRAQTNLIDSRQAAEDERARSADEWSNAFETYLTDDTSQGNNTAGLDSSTSSGEKRRRTDA